jgi:predicted LPLAT superfamily acyltransferase
MKQQWIERPEGGNAVALRWFIRCVLLVGRSVGRVLILPVTFYFLLRRGPERRASRSYLTRITGKPASWWQLWRHMLHFAVVGLDRVYLLAENLQRFDIRTHGVDQLMAALAKQRGIFLFGSHVGSFEVLRAFSQLKPEVQVRAVLDVQQTPMMTSALAILNPTIAAGIINARKDGTQTALEIKEALDQKALVTLLVDRARPGNTVVTADFLGERAPFPTAPWLLAATLKVPVVLCFGLYRGGNRYDLHFELFAETLTLERGRREADLQQIVQRYADRLAHHIREEPYNWFNFYDFWQKDRSGDDAVAVAGDEQQLVRRT